MSSRFEREVADGRLVRVSAPAKVILHGEHSVVYGKTALACSLDIRTTAQIRTGFNKRQIKIDFPDLGSSHLIPISKLKPVLDQVRTSFESAYCSSHVGSISRLIQDALPESCLDTELLVFLYLYTCMAANSSDGQLSPVEVSVSSDIPIGAGLGSSAAFSVSLAGAIFHFLRLRSKSIAAKNGHSNGQGSNTIQVNGSKSNGYLSNGDDKEDSDHEEHETTICGWAYNAEKIIHGNPSGLDNTICTYGGLLSYRKHPSTIVDLGKKSGKTERNGTPENFMESIAVPRNLRILLINTKVARNTKALVAKVGLERLNLLPKVTAHILEAMDRVSHECKDTFAAIVNNNNNSINNNGKTTTVTNGCAKAVEDQEKHRSLFHKLEQLIDVNQGLLSALGVSHPCLDQIAAICLCKGQLHAKLTGAGGGGFAFALITPFHTEAQVSSVKDELQSQGFECWDTNIAGDGIKLHSS